MRLLDLFVFKYNRTDFHELNLDWLISDVRTLAETLQNFISLNTIKYADPIQWNITTQYESNTIVIDPSTGVAYISVKPVPQGVSLANTDYWTPVFDLSRFISAAGENLTTNVEEIGAVYNTMPLNIGDWVVWNGVLYEVISDMPTGTMYLVDTNIKKITVEEFIHSFITTASENLTANVEETGVVNNTMPLNSGDWVVWNDVLYEVISDMPVGTSYIIDTNIKRLTVEDFIHSYVRDQVDKIFIDTTTDMISTDLSAGDVCVTLGYNTINDNGGAIFKISDTPGTDDLTVTLNNGLYAIYQHMPYHNTAMFGFVNDVTVDQTNKMNDVLKWLSDCTFDGLDYEILANGTLLPSGDNLVFTNLHLTYNTDLHYYLTFIDKNNISVTNSVIKKADNSFTDYNRHLRFENCAQCSVTNSKFINYGTAIHALTCENFMCDNIELEEVCPSTDAQFGYGIDTSAAHNIIKNVYAHNTDDTRGRHVVYFNYNTVYDGIVENVHVENWKTMTVNINCPVNEENHDLHITIKNCEFKNAMNATTGSSGTGLGAVINIGNLTTNAIIIIDDCVFTNCRFAAVANSSTDAKVFIHDCIYNCSSEVNIMRRKNILSAVSGYMYVDGFRVFDFNDESYNQFVWLDTSPHVELNNIHVDGVSTAMRLIAGGTGSCVLGLYTTVTPYIKAGADVTLTQMQLYTP